VTLSWDSTAQQEGGFCRPAGHQRQGPAAGRSRGRRRGDAPGTSGILRSFRSSMLVAREKRCAPVRMATPVPYSVWKTFASSTRFCSTSCVRRASWAGARHRAAAALRTKPPRGGASPARAALLVRVPAQTGHAAAARRGRLWPQGPRGRSPRQAALQGGSQTPAVPRRELGEASRRFTSPRHKPELPVPPHSRCPC